MKKKILALCVIIAMLGVAIIGGTMAYFTDTAEKQNTMVFGNVDIEINEYQLDDQGTKVSYTNDKPLLPYVGDLGWKTTVTDDWRQFTMKNVIDKYVTVKNTGDSDAYVRVWIALEAGDTIQNADGTTTVPDDYVGISHNMQDQASTTNWYLEGAFYATIHSEQYYVFVARYNTKLAKNDETVPSLCQIYLSKDATQEIAEALDGNDNDKYDVLVFSQGVQAAGFDNAEQALNAAFNAPSATNLPAFTAPATNP